MDEKTILERKKLIDNYLKKESHVALFDILLENIDNCTTYIRLDYVKKCNTYRVSWVNISSMNNKKIKTWINSNLIYPSKVEEFKRIIASNGYSQDFEDIDDINSNITVNSYLLNYEYNRNTFTFRRYIPKCWKFLADAIYILFDFMPRYIYPLFQIMIQKIIDPKVDALFAFDIKKDNVDSLFSEKVRKEGKEYFDKDKIVFIENFDNSLYGVIKDSENYLVNIIHNDEINEVQFSCSCHEDNFCKHMYALYLAYKNNSNKRFYKISYASEDLLESIKNFDYFLCVGIFEDYFVVVQNNSFALLPILDNDNKLSLKIVEDDDKKSLEKELSKYLDKKIG